MDCIIVGGVANGQLVRGVDPNANLFSLERPTHKKPLASPTQQDVELAKESTVYQLHVFQLYNRPEDKSEQPSIFGIGVPQGELLTVAFAELVKAYVYKVVADDAAATPPEQKH